MLKSILNLEGVSLLTKEQQKNLIGGSYAMSSTGLSGNNSEGTCCSREWRQNSMGYITQHVVCGIPKKYAQANAQSGIGGGNWCCDSCGSASWI